MMAVPIDFNDVIEVKRLPYSWISIQGVDLKQVGDYERECLHSGQVADQRKIAELLGNKVVHLRQHTLRNGFRYVTINLENGNEVYDDTEYLGLGGICSCGADHNHLVTVGSAVSQLKERPDLGNGFKLQVTLGSDGNPARYGCTESAVEKQFVANGKSVTVYYKLRPDYNGDGGDLFFRYRVGYPTISQWEKQFVLDSSGEPFSYYILDNKEIVSRENHCNPFTLNMRIHRKKKENSEFPQASDEVSITTSYRDQRYGKQNLNLEFQFDQIGRLHNVGGTKYQNNVDIGWNDDGLTLTPTAIEEHFSYSRQNDDAQPFIEMVFGRNISRQKLDVRKTLETIMEAAATEQDIDLATAVKFTNWTVDEDPSRSLDDYFARRRRL